MVASSKIQLKFYNASLSKTTSEKRDSWDGSFWGLKDDLWRVNNPKRWDFGPGIVILKLAEWRETGNKFQSGLENIYVQ